MYHIFTNEHKGLIRTYYVNENRFKVYHAETKTAVADIIEQVTAKGFIVSKVTNDLGAKITF